MRRPTRVYRPKGWAHYLDRDPHEQGDAALQRKNRRCLLGLDKKIERAKGKLWAEGSSDYLPGATLTEEQLAEAVSDELGMSVEDYWESLKAINKLKDDDALADADASTLFLWDLKKHGAPLLTSEQEVELARRARAGDERVIERLVSANLRLCARLAGYFRSRGLDRLLEYTDLVSAGVIGLRAAVARFDPERGTRLASFAYPYITGAIRDELEKATLIRLPREVASLANKIIRAMDQLSAQLGRKPTDDEIGAQLGLTADVVSRTLHTISVISQRTRSVAPNSGPNTTEAGGGGRPRFDADALDAWELRGGSQNYRADVDGAAFGPEDDQVTPAAETDLEANEAHARLYEALDTLTKQEREVVSRYFDLVENPDIERPNVVGGESLTAIAQRLGVSKQRASKVHRRALAKLRKALEVARATDA